MNNTFPPSVEVTNNGHLLVGGCDTIELARKYGTPLYIIDEKIFLYNANEYLQRLKEHYDNFLVLYAAKAFACTAIFALANKIGLGLDIVSGGELYLALKTNFNKENIYFHGNNKLKEEIDNDPNFINVVWTYEGSKCWQIVTRIPASLKTYNIDDNIYCVYMN